MQRLNIVIGVSSFILRSAHFCAYTKRLHTSSVGLLCGHWYYVGLRFISLFGELQSLWTKGSQQTTPLLPLPGDRPDINMKLKIIVMLIIKWCI